MRKVRDYKVEAEMLGARARKMKTRRLEHLGALVTATGADSLGSATLAGALLHAVNIINIDQRETWTTAGTAFFQRPAHTARRSRSCTGQDSRGNRAG